MANLTFLVLLLSFTCFCQAAKLEGAVALSNDTSPIESKKNAEDVAVTDSAHKVFNSGDVAQRSLTSGLLGMLPALLGNLLPPFLTAFIDGFRTIWAMIMAFFGLISGHNNGSFGNIFSTLLAGGSPSGSAEFGIDKSIPSTTTAKPIWNIGG